MAKHDKPTSRLTDVFASSQELAREEVVFPLKERSVMPPPATSQPEAPIQGEGVAIAGEAKPQKPKPVAKGKRGPGRPPKAEKLVDQTTSSIRLDPDLFARVDSYVNNRYALYKTKADLVRHALAKTLDELEPVLKKTEKLYEAHLGKGKGGE